MPRPLRIEYKGAWYHIINKGVGRRSIFRNDEQRSSFLKIVNDVCDVYDIHVHAYCLLPNQFHLLIQTPRANLSDAMRQLNSCYTLYYNSYNKTKSSPNKLFRDRFKAILIDADQYLSRVSRIIHLLPVTSRRAKKPIDYEWSSYKAYIKEAKCPKWLYRKTILDMFGEHSQIAQYRTFIENGNRDKKLKHFYSRKTIRSILGDKEFMEMAKLLSTGKRIISNDTNEVTTRLQPSLEKIMQTVASHFNVSVQELYQEKRGRSGGNLPRSITMTMARNPGGYPLREIATAINVSDISTISAAVKRTNEKLQHDKSLQKSINSIKKELFGSE